MSKITEKYLAEAGYRPAGGHLEGEKELYIKKMKTAADNIEDCMQLAKKEKRGEYSRLRGIYSDIAKLLSDMISN